MEDTQNCRNCDRVIDVPGQKFCPNCGQATPTRRIDWRFLGHELEHSVLHMDRGVLYTLKRLMLRPGHLIRDYLDGRREGIVKPLLLLMMSAAALVLLSHYLLSGDIVGSSLTDGMRETFADNDDPTGKGAELLKAFEYTKKWFNEHITLVTLVILPLEAVALQLAFLGVRKFNYPEWLVITAFLTAQMFVVWCISVPFQRLSPDVQPVMLLLAIAYNLFSVVQLFKTYGYPRWKSVLRGLAGFGALQIVVGGLSFVVAVVLVVLVASGKIQLPG